MEAALLNELESNIVEWVTKNDRHGRVFISDVFINKGYPLKDIQSAMENLFSRDVLRIEDGWVTFEWKEESQELTQGIPFMDPIGQLLRKYVANEDLAIPDHIKAVMPTNKKEHDPVNWPKHYNQGKISVADFIADQSLSFDRGSCVKYLCRAGVKEDPELTPEKKAVQDLEKAIWYLNHEIKWIKENGL